MPPVQVKLLMRDMAGLWEKDHNARWTEALIGMSAGKKIDEEHMRIFKEYAFQHKTKHVHCTS